MRTNEKVIKEISVGNVNIPISAKYIGDYEIGDIQDMIDDSKYTLPTATDTTLGGVNKGYTIPYIVGSSSDTAGVWTGSCSGITSYKDGLTIIYVPQKAGSNNGTTLNINGLGAKACYFNNSKMTTHFSANVPILLTYITQSGVGYWKCADYSATTYTSAYCTTSGGTDAKTASLSNYVLTSKTYVFISISNANTVQGPITLNINGKGAKPIYINGSASSASNYTLPAGTYIVYYDGTNYHFRTDGKLPNITYYSVATSSADGLLSKSIYSRMMGSSGWIITDFQDGPISIKQSADNVELKFSLSANRTRLGDGDTDDDTTVSSGTTTIPAADTSKAGLMSAADKSYLNFLSTNVINSSSGVLTSASIDGDESSATLSFDTVNRDTDGSVMTESIDVELPMASYDSVSGDKAGLMSAGDKHKLDNTNVSYGTCDTAAATAAKIVTLASAATWKMRAGSVVYVWCTYSNTANNPTLNVNGTGAQPIYYNGSRITTSNKTYATYANRLMKFIFTGEYYLFAGWGIDNNSTYANYSFGNGYATCATSTSTPNKVATYSNYALQTGGIVAVKFTYAIGDTSSTTLNINSQGSKSVYHNGSYIKKGIVNAGDIATFVYDGTRYNLISVDSAVRPAPYPNDGTSFSIIMDFEYNPNLGYVVNLDDYDLHEGGLYLVEAEEYNDVDKDTRCAALFVYKSAGSLLLNSVKFGYMSVGIIKNTTRNELQFLGSDGSGTFTLREIHTTNLYI